VRWATSGFTEIEQRWFTGILALQKGIALEHFQI
jgi:hypothetical protein